MDASAIGCGGGNEMISCVNEYEALTPAAFEIMEEVETFFTTLVCASHPDMAIRELEYLAITAIHYQSAHLILRNAMKKRKEIRKER